VPAIPSPPPALAVLAATLPHSREEGVAVVAVVAAVAVVEAMHGCACSLIACGKNSRCACTVSESKHHRMADGEEELELNAGVTKKEKKKSSKPKAPTEAAAIDAAVGGVAAMSVAGARPAASATTAPSGAVKYHDYLFLLERLYQTHNERFGGGGGADGPIGPNGVSKCVCPHLETHKRS
jgi:hypothetical protein